MHLLKLNYDVYKVQFDFMLSLKAVDLAKPWLLP